MMLVMLSCSSSLPGWHCLTAVVCLQGVENVMGHCLQGFPLPADPSPDYYREVLPDSISVKQVPNLSQFFACAYGLCKRVFQRSAGNSHFA